MITNASRQQRERYCRPGGLELIENCEPAKADNFKGWDIHHRSEIRDGYVNSKEELIMMNLYYNRPHEELIFLTRSEHMKLHHLKNISGYSQKYKERN